LLCAPCCSPRREEGPLLVLSLSASFVVDRLCERGASAYVSEEVTAPVLSARFSFYLSSHLPPPSNPFAAADCEAGVSFLSGTCGGTSSPSCLPCTSSCNAGFYMASTCIVRLRGACCKSTASRIPSSSASLFFFLLLSLSLPPPFNALFSLDDHGHAMHALHKLH